MKVTPDKRDGAFVGRILATHFQVSRQHDDALAIGAPGFGGVGVDGDVQHCSMSSLLDVFLQAREFCLQFEHQAPRFDQAFPAMLLYEDGLGGWPP